jgi:hypothetical protein
VNTEQWRAIFWLHWRLWVNKWRRGGTVNAVLVIVLAYLGVLFALGLFVVGLLLGMFGLSGASPGTILLVWDGALVIFLFAWMTGVVTDLQRSEVLSLNKFLHLPVPLTAAFLINYLSSLFSLTLLAFVPPMLGLTIGLIIARGPLLLLHLLVLAAFVLMITALTYQFRGWLAALMINKRRRQTILVVVMAVFILLANLPNFINLIVFSKDREGLDQSAAATYLEALVKKQRSLAEQMQVALIGGQALTVADSWSAAAQAQWGRSSAPGTAGYLVSVAEAVQSFQDRELHLQKLLRATAQANQALEQATLEVKQEDQRTKERIVGVAWWISVCVPMGWLPVSAMGLAAGNVVAALLPLVGLTLIGMASLWRSYRTTLRLYTGQFTSGQRAAAPAPEKAEPAEGPTLLEKKLPWVPEQPAAIAVAAFRSLTRAPEAKMALLSTVIVTVLMAVVMGRRSTNFPEDTRALLPFGAMAFILMTLAQIVGNQFGYDRNGFRVFVLSGARRRDILLGKNLAVAPFPLGMGLLVAVIVQFILPMRWDDFLALLPQFVSMYLLFCMLANWLSILAPARVPAGSLRAAKVGMTGALLHLLVFLVFYPLLLGMTLLPLLARVLFVRLVGPAWVPIGLVLAMLECVAVVFLYHLVLIWQGSELQAREQKVLDVVQTKAE